MTWRMWERGETRETMTTSTCNFVKLIITRRCRRQCCCRNRVVTRSIGVDVTPALKNVVREVGDITRTYRQTVTSHTVWRTALRPVVAACKLHNTKITYEHAAKKFRKKKQKMCQLRTHCNSKAAQRCASPYPLSLRRPCQVCSRSAYPLLFYSVVLLIRCDMMWPWPFTFHLERTSCTTVKLSQAAR